MIPLRLAFYALYVVLGAAIVVRVLAAGLRWEAFTGVVFGVLLAALGVYRMLQFVRRSERLQ